MKFAVVVKYNPVAYGTRYRMKNAVKDGNVDQITWERTIMTGVMFLTDGLWGLSI